jgi:hypothetical protein
MRFLSLLSFIFLVFSTQQAFAEPKPWVFSWGPSHFKNHDFEPYLDRAKFPHNSQWSDKDWKSEYWVQQRDNDEMKMLRSLYFADIFRDQYFDDEIPVLEVGPNFYNLSGYDKRRVTALVDDVYEVTASHEDGIFMIYDWHTRKTIGVYTKYGLQLQ